MIKIYKFMIIVIMLFGVQFVADAQQQVPIPDPISGVVDSIVREWKALFDKEATVVRVKANEVYINLGSQNGVEAGMEFELIRTGEVIIDPKTEETIGSEETLIGKIKVSKVYEKMSIGEIVSKEEGQNISEGDIAYLKVPKLTVAVTELIMIGGESNVLGATIAEELMTKLGGIRRFTILERSRIDKFLEELDLHSSDLIDPESRNRVGRLLGADLLVVGKMNKRETTVDLFVRLINTETGEASVPKKKSLRIVPPTITQLEISSRPAGATIYIDGRDYDQETQTIEFDLENQENIEVEVTLELDEYAPETVKITLRKGWKSKWTVELKPLIKNRDKGEMRMVYIPGGTFTMGDETGDMSRKFPWVRAPQHEIYVDAFYMDEHEVTNEQYCQFLNYVEPPGYRYSTILYPPDKYLIRLIKECKIEKHGNTYRVKQGYENHPVVCVYWHGANAYAKWAGGRLPTEAEWERAGRGGLVEKKYPNGDSISRDDANYDGSDTTPVKSFEPNGYGLYNMAGNVYEWCSDYWDIDYYERSPRDNPKGPSSGRYHVVRGGSYWKGSNRTRCSFRHRFESYVNCLGFRVVIPVGNSE